MASSGRPPLIVAVDFDGTVVDHRYPDVGADVPGAVEWLRRLVDRHGVRLILWTMRGGECLADAEAWFRLRGIPLWAVGSNPDQGSWTDSRKAYAHAYVDDAAVGCPTRANPRSGGRAFVDWSVVGPALESMAAERGRETIAPADRRP